MMDKTVKVDSELLKKVEKLVEREKYKYSSKKQVINLSIIEFLKDKSLDSSDKRSENKKGGKNE